MKTLSEEARAEIRRKHQKMFKQLNELTEVYRQALEKADMVAEVEFDSSLHDFIKHH
jgi:hypothetical protein